MDLDQPVNNRKELIQLALDFARRHNVSFQSGLVRPWGSWDLVIYVPGQPAFANTGETFGSAFPIEEGLFMFFDRVANDLIDSERLAALTQYMGQGQIDELKELFKHTT